MRILQINTERGWRGGERQTLLTALGLRAAGDTVALLVRAGGELEREARAVVAVRGQQGDISGAEVGDDKPPEELAVAVEEECARLVAGNAER